MALSAALSHLITVGRVSNYLLALAGLHDWMSLDVHSFVLGHSATGLTMMFATLEC